jgi:APA family basic amino acid/polyamine antiporter
MNALTVSALFYLRRKKPDLHRPYKAWGYPVLPLLFIGVVLWMVVNSTQKDWQAAVSGMGMMALGVPFYFLLKKGS